MEPYHDRHHHHHHQHQYQHQHCHPFSKYIGAPSVKKTCVLFKHETWQICDFLYIWQIMCQTIPGFKELLLLKFQNLEHLILCFGPFMFHSGGGKGSLDILNLPLTDTHNFTAIIICGMI